MYNIVYAAPVIQDLSAILGAVFYTNYKFQGKKGHILLLVFNPILAIVLPLSITITRKSLF